LRDLLLEKSIKTNETNALFTYITQVFQDLTPTLMCMNFRTSEPWSLVCQRWPRGQGRPLVSMEAATNSSSTTSSTGSSTCTSNPPSTVWASTAWGSRSSGTRGRRCRGSGRGPPSVRKFTSSLPELVLSGWPP